MTDYSIDVKNFIKIHVCISQPNFLHHTACILIITVHKWENQDEEQQEKREITDLCDLVGTTYYIILYISE